MSTDAKIRVAIIGATAYTSREVIRLLLGHPHAQIVALCSRREPQPRIDEIFPEFTGRLDMHCEAIKPEALAGRADVALLCLPNNLAMEMAPALIKAGLKVIDFSADYRLKNPSDYRQWYGKQHVDLVNLEKAVYGIPELFRRQIRGASLIANPGCYPTSVALGVVPLLKAGLIDPTEVIVDAASGISGAGREPKPEHHFPERHETFEAYKVGDHRHVIEIERTLGGFSGQQPVNVIFVPHLVPMERGILSTIYLSPRHEITTEQIAAVFESTYAGERFVRWRSSPPRTADVARSNFCDLSAKVVKSRIVVLSAIDNVVKGAAGQAIQNMNILFDLPETAGLL